MRNKRSLKIRQELPGDLDSIYFVNEQAFGRKEEAELVDDLRNGGKALLSLVALMDDKIVGHILFSAVTIEPEIKNFAGITLAPVAVLPEYQNKNIGSRLIRAGVEECKAMGYEIMFLVGHPNYYPRFGFERARAKGLECEYEAPDEAWMVLELKPGALAGKRGKIRFQPEFAKAV